jgi:hypothetical protein
MSEWPHQFTKNGKPTQIGETKITDNKVAPIMAQPMICVHCYKEYIQNMESQPSGCCPARYDSREIKRVKNGR